MILDAFCLISTINIVLTLQFLSSTSCNRSDNYYANSPPSNQSAVPATNSFLLGYNNAGYEYNSEQLNITKLLLDRFSHLFPPDSIRNNNNNNDSQPQSVLETRKIDQDPTRQGNSLPSSAPQNCDNDQHESVQANRRNYFRIMNRVFSRVDLPEAYKTARLRGSHCAQHIGCVEEIPNFPSILKKANVSSSFTIYTRQNPKIGHKILYEPILHHQLQDANTSETELEDKLIRLMPPIVPQVVGGGQPLPAGIGGPASPLVANNILLSTIANNRPHHHHLHHHHHHIGHLHNHRDNQIGRLRQHTTAVSWRTAAKVIHSQEYPFDLSALERCGFNASLNTRIIVGGYFAKEDEEWIDEVVKQWLLLEPSNIIKVSWADANRGLYHTAAYNSRIVARQLTLFLHYLDQMFHIDLNRFHLVGHSLGAHIAGFVGSDNEGRIARITGLDPAGPIFVELNASLRLDPSDAKFVDVVHTNGGSITKGALGLSIPSGHVDYYCNGGSLQPGCYFSSVTKSIMDPVERVACSHRRSYRYFIEITKLAISEIQAAQAAKEAEAAKAVPLEGMVEALELIVTGRDSEGAALVGGEKAEPQMNVESRLPRSFLFEAKHDDLVRLMQPEIALASTSLRRDLAVESLAPLKRHLEFHLLQPNFPPGKRGMYFFRTRSESPFFASKQYALTVKTDTVIRRKIALSAKLDHALVAEVELDEIPGVCTLVFAPNDPRTLNDSLDGQTSRVPQLSIMWKYRSFNLLLNQQNELHLSGLELSLLDTDADEEQEHVIKYSSSIVGSSSSSSSSSINGQSLSSSTSIPPILSPSSSFSPTLSNGGSIVKLGFTGGSNIMALTRNQWYKFEGRLVPKGVNI